jgi:murein L,D-transpeptidase YafK
VKHRILQVVLLSLLLPNAPIYGSKGSPYPGIDLDLISNFKPDHEFLNRLWSHRKSDSDMDHFLSPYIFIVDKQSAKMHLYLYNGDTYHIKSYNIITGKNPGDKNHTGDLKTPEGIYFFGQCVPSKELDKRYGTIAITTNYPNNIDKIEKKNGHGIWLHGTESEERVGKKYDTEGCVAGTNIDVESMKVFIRPEITPMIIVDSFVKDPLKYSASPPSELLNFIESWRTAWSNKNIDRYMAMYSEKFFDPSTERDKKAWEEYKKTLNQKYSKINVNIGSVSIYQHPRYSVVQFIQDYNATGFSTKSLKRLYIENVNGSYKIKSEESMDLGPIRSI